jgi:hypothetical protein
MAGSGGEEGVSFKFERMPHTPVLRVAIGFFLLTLVAEIDFRSAGALPRSLRCGSQKPRAFGRDDAGITLTNRGWGHPEIVSVAEITACTGAIAIQLLYFACREIFEKD